MFLKKVKTFINYKRYLDKIHRSNDDAYALQIIYKLFPEFTYLPFTPFALNPYTIVHILNDILLNDRKQIIEFGSGVSTIVISQFIKVNNLNTKILSIDNNKGWQEIIKKEVKKYSGDDNLTLIHADIVKNLNADYIVRKNYSWYDNTIIAEKVKTLKDIDLIIVDGPGTEESAYIRYPALLSVKNNLAKSFCVFLDDTRRDGEREIISMWNNQFNGDLKFEKMYATISVGKKYSTKPLSH
ncbi:class I SAM-dependent methyltransferase [Winogradskyella sp.]|uniref:class I SAM-dependent methyltransferase n=1 Tax=Winogradskyella sp. TaxID=1883156 RepID=UPI00261432B2|nr:class I SAM-dependent methyltransferase [Winogradskyella sp.]